MGRALTTHLSGTATAIDDVQRSSTHYLQRPDAEHLHYDPSRTSLSGWGLELVGGKLAGSPWRAAWGGHARSPELNPNDLGFMRRADQQHAFFWIQRLQDQPTELYRFFSVDSSAWVDKTFGPEITSLGASINSYWHFSNNMSAYLDGMRRLETLEVSLLRGGPGFLRPPTWDGWWGVSSDNRKPYELGLRTSWAWREADTLRRGAGTLIGRLRPTAAVLFSLEPSFSRTLDALHFVDGDDPDNIVLGRWLRDTASVTARVNLAIALGFTLEAYAMPYVSAGSYQRFYRVVEPQAEQFEDRIETTAYDGDDRFVVAQVRSNVVLRYDYAPGSCAYLVWFHEQSSDRTDAGSIAVVRDGEQLLRAAATDIVMLKLVQYLAL